MKCRIHLLIAVPCIASISLGVRAAGSAEARERWSLSDGCRFRKENPQWMLLQPDHSSVRAWLSPSSTWRSLDLPRGPFSTEVTFASIAP